MILTRDHGAVRELQLDRPPANALSPELVDALAEAVRSAPREGARAVVLSGLPRRFSGGLDVPFLLTLDRAGIAAAWRGFYRSHPHLCPKGGTATQARYRGEYRCLAYKLPLANLLRRGGGW